MRTRTAQFVVLCVLAEIASASISNSTTSDVKNKLDVEAINKKLGVLDVQTRRKSKDRSTSSSSGEKQVSGSSSENGESLDLSTSSSSTSSSEGRKKKWHYRPKSSAERTGWRKWHRKCTPCPEEMDLKWRNPRIKWICGAYQRARRSFKSLCMMHFRNCQDGTMFTKIHDHRCEDDDPNDDRPHGEHFFYDYKVDLTDDSSSTSSESSSSSDTSNSHDYLLPSDH